MRSGSGQLRKGTLWRLAAIGWVAVVVALGPAGVAAAGVNRWTTGGPDGGRVTTLAIDPASLATLYAGTSGGGVFRSVDGGGSWSAASTGLTDLNIFVLPIDPETPTTVYAGTSGGVFKSVNGGASWSPASTGLTNLNIFALAIDPASPATLYAGTDGGGVFKSVNGGGSWSAANTGLTDLNILALTIDEHSCTGE